MVGVSTQSGESIFGALFRRVEEPVPVDRASPISTLVFTAVRRVERNGVSCARDGIHFAAAWRYDLAHGAASLLWPRDFSLEADALFSGAGPKGSAAAHNVSSS